MIKVNAELCTGCGLCVEACTFGQIELVEGVPLFGPSCNVCGMCAEECPADAIEIEQGKKDWKEIESTSDVWVWLETRDDGLSYASIELLAIARSLAEQSGGKVKAVIFAHPDHPGHRLAIGFGADEVWAVDCQGLTFYETGVYTSALCSLVKKEKPGIMLFSATCNGRDLAPRLAARLRCGLTADCTHLEFDRENGLLLQTRPAFGGNIMATIVTPYTRPQMATVRPGIAKPLPFDGLREGIVHRWTLETAGELPIRVIEQVKRRSCGLEEADVVVAAGRGVGGPRGLELVSKLAEALGGELAASRGPVEEGWIEPSRQVGQTGKTVRPKIYIACGISGALQHVVGMQDSETIIAINKDPKAPIFQVADYGVVGDVFQVIPRLLAVLKNGEQ